MFEKGEFIIYGTSGVCEVRDYMSASEEETTRTYYVLVPLRSKGSTIYSPVDNQKVLMRPVMTKEEACLFLTHMGEFEDLEIRDSRTQEQQYREVLQSGSYTDSIRLLKALYTRKKQREEKGRRITSVDEKYLYLVRDSLVNELSVALDMDAEEADKLLKDKMGA
ncbi:MAG: CarD family transcriptional regulator [Eubacteriales bacterium]|nr:CarD family transcriptional regulator [Eubacteriales bacterium]